AMLSRGRVVGYERIASIRLERPAPATIDRLRARLVDADGLTFGRRYAYVATAVDSTGRSSAPSPRAVVTFLAAPRAPGDLAADAGDSRVHLTWSAPSEYIDGKPVTGPLRYVVLRGQAEGALSPVTSEPVPETAFDDTGLTNDTDYRYAVLAVRSDPDGTA